MFHSYCWITRGGSSKMVVYSVILGISDVSACQIKPEWIVLGYPSLSWKPVRNWTPLGWLAGRKERMSLKEVLDGSHLIFWKYTVWHWYCCRHSGFHHINKRAADMSLLSLLQLPPTYLPIAIVGFEVGYFSSLRPTSSHIHIILVDTLICNGFNMF